MDKDTRLLIEKYLEKLEEDYGVTYDWDSDSRDTDKVGDEIDGISLSFPDDVYSAHYEIEEFLDYMSDIDSYKEVDKTTSRTDHIRQTVLYFRYNGYDQYEDKLLSYSFVDIDYIVRIVKQPMLIGMANSLNGNSDDDLCLGCTEPYIALELKYTGKNRLTKEKEDRLFERITFFLTKELKTSIYVTTVRDVRAAWNEVYLEDEDEEDNALMKIKVKDLIGYSPMLRLYKQALATEDPEIRFLQFYKIIEHISPVVAKMEAYDKLNKRLDMLASSERDYKYLDSLISITRKYDTDIKDEYLAISVIQKCVDVIPLWEHLPAKLQKQIRSSLHIQGNEINDENVKDEQLASLQKQIANILYSTRNNIVHAKSNYIPTSLELQGEELTEGNIMMDKIAMSIIQWNERQPETYRV